MDRLIIPNIEGRILLGITMFVSIMVLVGWVAINEPGRMAAFEEQHTARAIERGAELFAANCSSCHGKDGRGGPQAPGLNSPHLFGHDFLATVNGEIGSRERELLQDIPVSITELQAQRDDLFTEIGQEGLSDTRREEIVAQISEVDSQLETLTVRQTTLQDELAPLYDERETLLSQMEPAIAAGYLPRLEEKRQEAIDTDNPLVLTNYLAQDTSRLTQVSWGSDLPSYITTTLIHGRPGSAEVWPGPMVAWSQRAGGPLRDDQISDIVSYIQNWDKGDNWTIGDLNSVGQFAKLHGGTTGGGDMAAEIDTAAITDSVVALEGDAANGEALYISLGCSGCHNGGVVGPATTGTWSRAISERLPNLDGYTVEHYLVESIVAPNAYVVDGYSAGVMPQDFWTSGRVSEQDLADILAYLESQG
ncbi:MAG: c-type cytochrome [Anaerolineae bacterium]|nr:c-type cytochrome [Anaerolineae bacterium]